MGSGVLTPLMFPFQVLGHLKDDGQLCMPHTTLDSISNIVSCSLLGLRCSNSLHVWHFNSHDHPVAGDQF